MSHLKSADFFDVEKFPTMAFKSTHVKSTGDGELAVEGDLTIRGVTRKATFAVEGPTAPAKDPWGNTRIGVSSDHQDQPERFRSDLECRAGNGWHSGGRRSNDHARRAICESLSSAER